MAEPGVAGLPAGPGVGEVAALYLGNLLYALERCALALDAEGKGEEAAFYRGIGRLMAEAHARGRPPRP